MSLLDDVSIVVTPNGYKAGELYAVIPVPTEGAEILSQPVDLQTDFVVNSGGVIVDADTFTSSGGAFDGIKKSGFLTIGKRYKLIIEGTTTSSGFTFGILVSGNEYGSGFGTHYFTATTQDLWIRQQTSGTTNITSFSIKEYTSADMDVTRATAATRVDENGLVNYAEVLGGENIDLTTGSAIEPTDWGSATTSGISYLATTGTTSYYDTGFSVTSGITYKLSFTLSDYTGSSNLGFSGTGGVSNNAKLEADGSYSEYFIASSTAELRLFGRSTNTGVFSNISVKEVTRDNVPRIDYTGGGCPHILAEPQRTNLIPYSEDFTDSSWTKTNVTIASNSVTSPDGTVNADYLQENSSNATHIIRQSFTLTASDYTLSIFAKQGTGSTRQIGLLFNELGIGALFNLNDGSAASLIGSPVVKSQQLENGWFKFSITATSTAISVNCRIYLGKDDVWTSAWTGDGSSGAYIYGAQLEEGSYATSYIPTSGSTVTRNQDIFTRDGIGSLINSTEGVLFAEVSALVEVDTARRFITLNDGGASNNVVLRYEATGVITARYQVGGVAQCSIAFATTITNSHKIAFKYKVNDFALWIDGTEVGTDTSGSVLGADTINKISFDSGNGSFPFYGKVKQLQVFKTALTDTELATLTTI